MTEQELKKFIKKQNLFITEDGLLASKIKPSDESRRVCNEHRAEIMALIKTETEAKERAAAEREAKIAAIDGLTEIKKAIYDHEKYHRDFERMMDDEFNDGLRPPKKPESDINELMSKYPRAAAYIKAEDYSYSPHYAKSAIGIKALEQIINGENYDKVLADMEKEWSDYCESHMWD